MSFDARQVLFLQGLVEDHPTRRSAGLIARHFCEHFSLGQAIGRFIEYRTEHHNMALSLLQAHDLPLNKLSTSGLRADSAKFGGLSEKTFSVSPHADSIAIKCFGNCFLDSTSLITPPGSYLGVTSEFARNITCDKWLLVENFETLRILDQYRWIDYRNESVVAIFRGDSILSPAHVKALLRTRSEPIWAFVDFDPAGLIIANSLPADRLERLILPDWPQLRRLADTAHGRWLFDSQLSYAEGVLDKATSPLLKDAWTEMRNLTAGLAQEGMMYALATP